MSDKFLEKKYFEDMQIGDQVISVGRTITEADIVNFAGLSGDYNTLHTDAEFARQSIAGERIAHGMLPYVIASGLFTRTAYNLSVMDALTAFVEIRSWKFLKPVLIGDTIRVLVELVEKLDSKPESKNGKVVFRRTVLNQKDEVVQRGEWVMLYKKRSML
ncbi:MaoC/PaaZ C-terminal domain-containing protein [Fusibacter ferrireducens]|uniref:MaoC family dehydratase N-terminal domain-containing protein n=1 Tax=Fusibacter ferrireducens TaxID=2785058 RepID=A0ABR9ZX53_9FIRM|nr:MaoC/PaaZ C-terminal domain-containing protein [Fusibacter ferrireducens]MBF4695052.1 MaoC family dehydratase N-terminal domain-containing protein [Fusibacter ferrireducens]